MLCISFPQSIVKIKAHSLFTWVRLYYPFRKEIAFKHLVCVLFYCGCVQMEQRAWEGRTYAVGVEVGTFYQRA